MNDNFESIAGASELKGQQAISVVGAITLAAVTVLSFFG